MDEIDAFKAMIAECAEALGGLAHTLRWHLNVPIALPTPDTMEVWSFTVTLDAVQNARKLVTIQGLDQADVDCLDRAMRSWQMAGDLIGIMLAHGAATWRLETLDLQLTEVYRNLQEFLEAHPCERDHPKA